MPGVPVPPYHGAPFLLVRDGRDPLAFCDDHGSWLEWLPATGEKFLNLNVRDCGLRYVHESINWHFE